MKYNIKHQKRSYKMKVFVVFLSVFILTTFTAGCKNDDNTVKGDDSATNFKLSYTEEDNIKFNFDPKLPYSIEFGRGSGWHGFDIIFIENSIVQKYSTLYSNNQNTFELDIEQKNKLDTLISSLDLKNLPKLYSADVCDGTQWYLTIKQTNLEKKIYFDNHFPEYIQDFSVDLDLIVNKK